MDMVSIDLEKVRTLYEKIPILMLLHQVTVSLAVGIQNSITLKHVASLSGRITITGKL